MVSIWLMLMCLLNVYNLANWQHEKKRRIEASLEMISYKDKYERILREYEYEKRYKQRNMKVVQPSNNEGWKMP